MPHLLEQVEAQVHTLKQPEYLLTVVDQHAPPHVVLNFAAAEVAEVVAALDANESEIATAHEIADVLVFFFSWAMVHAPQLDVSKTVYVNGFGRRSDALEKLQDTILEAEYDPRSATEVIARVWSLALWNPYAMQGLQRMDEVIKKVQGNYPPALFTVYDPSLGRPSLPEEVLPRYQHLKAGLRLIRDRVQRTLAPADWQSHVYLLQSWQQSSWALQQLEQQLVTPSTQVDQDVAIFSTTQTSMKVTT